MTHATDLLIRTVTDADLPAILEIYAQAGFGRAPPLDLERARALLRRIESYPDYRLYVIVEHDGTPVGTYALLVMDNIAQDGRPLAVVEQVAVATHRQGAGLGTVMMHHAMAEARKADCYKLQLSSHTRFKNAHAFYDRLGFTRHGYSYYVDLD